MLEDVLFDGGIGNEDEVLFFRGGIGGGGLEGMEGTCGFSVFNLRLLLVVFEVTRPLPRPRPDPLELPLFLPFPRDPYKFILHRFRIVKKISRM